MSFENRKKIYARILHDLPFIVGGIVTVGTLFVLLLSVLFNPFSLGLSFLLLIPFVIGLVFVPPIVGVVGAGIGYGLGLLICGGIELISQIGESLTSLFFKTEIRASDIKKQQQIVSEVTSVPEQTNSTAGLSIFTKPVKTASNPVGTTLNRDVDSSDRSTSPSC